MTGKSPIVLLDKSEISNNCLNSSYECIKFDLDIFGKKIDFGFILTHDEARLSDIVPLARMVSNKITESEYKMFNKVIIEGVNAVFSDTLRSKEN